jgi:hypothetical protein
MKQALFICLLLFYSSFAFCQHSYVTSNGQTILGTIENYREWSKNPTTVLFKDNSGTAITLTPQNCKSFTAGSDTYVGYNGTRILNTDNAMRSQSVQSNVIIRDSVHVFLRQIYQFNNYTLYKLFDKKRTNFYFSDNGDIKELEFYETIENKDIVPFNGYKSFLNDEFSDKNIAGLQQKINTLSYKENDLINFFADILNDKQHSSENLRNKYPGEILIGIGANQNVATLENNGPYIFHRTSVSPSFEFALRIYNQRNFGRIFFQPSINAFSLLSDFSKAPAKVKAMVVTFNLGAGYMFVKKPDFSFYVEAAGALPVLFNFQTQQGTNGKYVKSHGPDDRITVHPEAGIIIKRNLNISASYLLPIRLPFNSNIGYAYKLSQASIALRYAFIQGNGKK